MAETIPGDLEGRSIQRQDVADTHRWHSYHDFLDLDPRTDSPLAFHWLLFTELPRDLRPDGHATHMQPFPELPYPRRMWAGGEINWKDWLLPGLEISRTTTIVRAEAKSGGSGEFLLASLQHQLNAGSREYIDERQDVVFLQQETRPGARPPREPTFEPEWRLSRRFSTVDLFRYSALTLNSHRIHYDAPYATTEEGFPALVVQAPLLASQLMQEAAKRRSQERPVRFSYRSVAPVFVDKDISVVGCQGDSSDELAVIGDDGGVRMTATMSFAPEA